MPTKTLKDYLEEQRDLAEETGKDPVFRFSNVDEITPEVGSLTEAQLLGLPPSKMKGDPTYTYDEEQFTAETEKMLETPGGGIQYTEMVPGREPVIPEGPPQEFSYAAAEAARTAPPPPPPGLTAETVKPGGEIPEELREKYGLSESARYAMDQKTGQPKKEKKAVPEKPPSQEQAAEVRYAQKLGAGAEKRFGVNPTTFSMADAMEELKNGDEAKDLFTQAMMGQNAWWNRDKLTADQKAVWEPVLNKFLASKEKELEMRKKDAERYYKGGMDMYWKRQGMKKDFASALKTTMKPLFKDEMGNQLDIPAEVLAEYNQIGSKMIDKGMDRQKVLANIVQAHQKKDADLRAKQHRENTALLAITPPGMMHGAGKRKAATAEAAAAVDAGVPVERVKEQVIKLGWTKAEAEMIVADVSRETTGTTKYNSPIEVREAVNRDEISVEEGKRIVTENWMS